MAIDWLDSDPCALSAEMRARAADLLHTIANRLQSTDAAGDRASEVRQLLDEARNVLDRFAGPAPRRRPLRVGVDGRWFQLGSTSRVSLDQRRALRDLLLALAAARATGVLGTVSARDLIGRTWRDERIIERAARARLKVGIYTLRSLGLRDAIVTDRHGYGLASDIDVLVEQ